MKIPFLIIGATIAAFAIAGALGFSIKGQLNIWRGMLLAILVLLAGAAIFYGLPR